MKICDARGLEAGGDGGGWAGGVGAGGSPGVSLLLWSSQSGGGDEICKQIIVIQPWALGGHSLGRNEKKSGAYADPQREQARLYQPPFPCLVGTSSFPGLSIPT